MMLVRAQEGGPSSLGDSLSGLPGLRPGTDGGADPTELRAEPGRTRPRPGRRLFLHLQDQEHSIFLILLLLSHLFYQVCKSVSALKKKFFFVLGTKLGSLCVQGRRWNHHAKSLAVCFLKFK